MGEIWRLETTRGSWAVKWQFPWAPTEARPADLRVQAAASAAGIPLPLPVTTPSGDAVTAVGERHVRVYPWLDLRPAVQVPAPAEVAAEVGRLLGLLHALALPTGEPIDPWYTTPPAAGDWDRLAGRAGATGVAWATRLVRTRPLIDEVAALIVPSPRRPPIVCHRDFSPSNVLPTRPARVLPTRPDGALVVLDWEDAGPGHPERELGTAVLAWAAGRRFDATAARHLLAGYAAAAGGLPPMCRGVFSGTAAVHLNFLHAMAGQALDDPAHRDFAEKQVTSLLDHDLDDLRAHIALASKALDLPA
jgi:Ser/Thr protein kinase RdoA (MazF antagonist)